MIVNKCSGSMVQSIGRGVEIVIKKQTTSKLKVVVKPAIEFDKTVRKDACKRQQMISALY